MSRVKDDTHEPRSVSNVLLDVRFAIFKFCIFNFCLSICQRCPLNRPCGLRTARLNPPPPAKHGACCRVSGEHKVRTKVTRCNLLRTYGSIEGAAQLPPGGDPPGTPSDRAKLSTPTGTPQDCPKTAALRSPQEIPRSRYDGQDRS